VTVANAAATYRDEEISHAIIQLLVEGLEKDQLEIGELIVDFNLSITVSEDEKAENKDHRPSSDLRDTQDNNEDSDEGKDR
jgi:hypothetical protein